MYDFLIVGAGLFGATFAFKAKEKGYNILVIDKRNHIGGNCYTEQREGIILHKYGAHIFHTSNKEIWNFLNRFSQFNNFINTPIAKFKGKIFNLPFNMNTFYQIWGVKTPTEARNYLKKEQKLYSNIVSPQNLEEQAIRLIGKEIFEILIKGYTEKQWGKECKDLPPSIIKRIPVRFSFSNNYFNDKYQGIPESGYTDLIDKMLSGIPIKLNENFSSKKEYWESIAKKIIFTGPIDEYFNYCFGALNYRSLRFETERLNIDDYQGVAVVNYTDKETPFTRIIEHKHFSGGNQEYTYITKEFPANWEIGKEAYYPVNDNENNRKYLLYKSLADKQNKVIFGGRLGLYKYYDMDKTVEYAIELTNKLL